MTYREAMLQAKREYVQALGRELSWKVPEMARVAGVNRTAMYRLISAIAVQKPWFRSRGNSAWQSLGT